MTNTQMGMQAAKTIAKRLVNTSLGFRLIGATLGNRVRIGSIKNSEEEYAQIRDALAESGIIVSTFNIDVQDYRRWVKEAGYTEFPEYPGKKWSSKFTEKSLEHYLATTLLQISAQDVYIDIANGGSFVPEIVQRLYGCTTYRQDLEYPAGVNGNRIGGDAGQMPLLEGFVTKMALHCSFEHFEEDADIRFIKEANRVLGTGGKICILPLYMHGDYAIQTDPVTWFPRQKVPFCADAVIYLAKGWANRHGRFYDISRFTSRIVENLGELNLSILFVENEKEVDVSCYVKFIALFEKR